MIKRNFAKYLLVFLSWNILLGAALLFNPGAARADVDIEKARAFNDNCLRCHGAEGLKMKMDGETISLYVNENEYYASQHGTNRCTSCHTDIVDYPHVGALKGKALKDLRKKVNDNCQRCHADVTKVYATSVHGQANAEGKPVFCWSCHGVHNIMKRENPAAKDYKTNIPTTCATCHEEVMESYEETFHGKAVTLGSTTAATCVNCHSFHDIKSQKDPTSMVNKKNIAKTCAKCHFAQEPNFANGTEHWRFERSGAGAPMYWTLKFLVWLTIGTIAVFFVHQELDLYRRLKNLKNGNHHH